MSNKNDRRRRRRSTSRVDPAAAAAVSSMEGTDRKRRRSEKTKQNRRERLEAGRETVTWELDKAIVAAVREVASLEDISYGSLSNILMQKGLESFAAGDLQIDESNSELTRSPAYRFTSKIDPDHIAALLAEIASSEEPAT